MPPPLRSTDTLRASLTPSHTLCLRILTSTPRRATLLLRVASPLVLASYSAAPARSVPAALSAAPSWREPIALLACLFLSNRLPVRPSSVRLFCSVWTYFAYLRTPKTLHMPSFPLKLSNDSVYDGSFHPRWVATQCPPEPAGHCDCTPLGD
jgi:hypothetical protein